MASRHARAREEVGRKAGNGFLLTMYTDEELKSAVEQLVRSNVRRPYDSRGVRRTDITYSDYQDIFSSVFVLYPSAIYYVVGIACANTSKVLDTQLTAVNEFLTLVRGVGRHVNSVNNVSTLANARAALEDLVNASISRSSGFTSATDTDAYKRFDTNTSKFLSDVASSVVVSGDIAKTPDECRALLPYYYKDLEKGVSEVVRRIGLIANAEDDFDSVNLATTLYTGVVQNAHNVLQGRYNELAVMSPSQRLTVLTDVVLDILATRAAVKGFGDMGAPGMFYSITGTGTVAGPVLAASLTSELLGPYPILGDSNQLLCVLDNTGSTTVSLQPAFVAAIDGTTKEPYVFDAALPNLNFRLGSRDSTGAYGYDDVVFAAATLDAYEVCTAINAVIAAADPWIAEPYCNPLRYAGNVDVTDAGGGKYAFTAVNPVAVDFVALGVAELDRIVIKDVTSSVNGAVYEVTAAGVFTDHIIVAPVHGGAALELNKTINISNGGLAVRLRLTDNNDVGKPDYRATALALRSSVYIPISGATTALEQQLTAATIGFYPLMEAISRQVTAAELTAMFNANPSAAIGGVARVQASTSFDDYKYTGAARTNPYDAYQLVLARYSDTATSVTVLSTAATFYSTTLAANTVVGDIIVVRSSTIPANVGVYSVVTAVHADRVVATLHAPFTAPDTNVGVDVGPDLRTDYRGSYVVISGDTFNDGKYEISALGTTPLDVTLTTRMPVPSSTGNLPIACTASVGRDAVVFASLSPSLTASILVSSTSTAFSYLFSTSPQYASSTTTYFVLPSSPKGLAEGDTLELHYTSVAVADYAEVITEVSGVQLTLAHAVPAVLPAFKFDVNSPLPFARVRRKAVNNYDVVKRAANTWLASLDTDYFLYLATKLNPLLVNTNPTPALVGDAVAALQAMYITLSGASALLLAYTSDVVPQVDVMVNSLREKGADRAIDLLLECRFSEFMGAPADDMSYSTYAQSVLREVMRNDLPIRKFNREGKYSAENARVASWEEKDFEFDKDDGDSAETDTGAQGNV